MFNRYIRFHDAIRGKDSLIWWVGTSSHGVIWDKLKKINPNTFESAVSAGSAFYDFKSKKLVTYDYSPTLNLVGNAIDGEEISDEILDNRYIEAFMAVSRDAKSDSYMCDLVVLPHVYLSGIVKAFEENRRVVELSITYRTHDNAVPFLVPTNDIAEKNWLDVAVKRLS